MAKVYILDRKSVVTGNEFRIELLVKVSGEIQYHYLSTSRNMNVHDKETAVNDYVARNVKFRNLSDEEQQNHIKAFGGRL